VRFKYENNWALFADERESAIFQQLPRVFFEGQDEKNGRLPEKAPASFQIG
jgi:hypothetical protein